MPRISEKFKYGLNIVNFLKCENSAMIMRMLLSAEECEILRSSIMSVIFNGSKSTTRKDT